MIRFQWASLMLMAFSVIAGEPVIDDLAWMSGTWRAENEGVVMEEVWTSPGGGMMLGLHRDAKGSKGSFEFLRIAQTDDGIVYFASPGGKAPTPFRLTESQESRAVFENPEHDFPKRIIYWRVGDDLCAQIEGEPDSGGPQWCWKKVE